MLKEEHPTFLPDGTFGPLPPAGRGPARKHRHGRGCISVPSSFVLAGLADSIAQPLPWYAELCSTPVITVHLSLELKLVSSNLKPGSPCYFGKVIKKNGYVIEIPFYSSGNRVRGFTWLNDKDLGPITGR